MISLFYLFGMAINVCITKYFHFPTAGPVGFQSLGLGLGPGDLQPSKSGMEPWNPGVNSLKAQHFSLLAMQASLEPRSGSGCELSGLMS